MGFWYNLRELVILEDLRVFNYQQEYNSHPKNNDFETFVGRLISEKLFYRATQTFVSCDRLGLFDKAVGMLHCALSFDHKD